MEGDRNKRALLFAIATLALASLVAWWRLEGSPFEVQGENACAHSVPADVAAPSTAAAGEMGARAATPTVTVEAPRGATAQTAQEPEPGTGHDSGVDGGRPGLERVTKRKVRLIGTRSATTPGVSPVEVRPVDSRAMPIPEEVAPPRRSPSGPVRPLPRPDPSPILRPGAPR